MMLSRAPTAGTSGGATVGGGGGGVVSSARGYGSITSSPRGFIHPSPPLFSKGRSRFVARNPPPKSPYNTHLTVANAADGGGGGSGPASASPKSNPSGSPPFVREESVTFVGEETVPLEGVIQFEKPNSSARLNKWGRVALLAGGDVLALLLFSAIGRFSHGFSVFDTETLRTADPFIAGWFLSAYFVGGYGEDGRGMNGRSKAVTAAAKSWSLGIPAGIIIRALTIGHIPPTNFIAVTMGSTAVLLIGWRALLFSIWRSDKSKNDVYKSGSPFELFDLLTSLVRRW